MIYLVRPCGNDQSFYDIYLQFNLFQLINTLSKGYLHYRLNYRHVLLTIIGLVGEEFTFRKRGYEGCYRFVPFLYSIPHRNALLLLFRTKCSVVIQKFNSWHPLVEKNSIDFATIEFQVKGSVPRYVPRGCTRQQETKLKTPSRCLYNVFNDDYENENIYKIIYVTTKIKFYSLLVLYWELQESRLQGVGRDQY